MEKHLDFEKRMYKVHKENRINKVKCEALEGLHITDSWKIIYSENSGKVLINAAKDLKDYFKVSMNLDLPLEKGEHSKENSIFLCTDEDLAERSFRLKVSDRIIISGCDERYTSQGVYYFEDELNFNEAPIITERDEFKTMRFAMRTITSGLNDAKFPDDYLRMIAHAGMTAVDVFVGDILTNEQRVTEVRDLIKRAGNIGLDVYIYPHIENTMHPEDDGAYEYYDNTYGKIMRLLPGIKGMILVGESCEFPSKDERTTGKIWYKCLDEPKPSPGWFPCSDYPQFVSMLNRVVHSYDAKAELVFWTYNWGYEDENLRKELLRNVPSDITMMATFEMYEKVEISEDINEYSTDYTLWQIGPGKYFSSEAEVAKEKNLKMYCMANTAGNTWDIGGVPFLPAPYRWIERWKAVNRTSESKRIDGIREAHSYGFWPSFITDMAKYAYMLPEINLEELLKKFVIRDFGEENLNEVLKAFKCFSEGMAHCVSTNEDQWGPARVGPSYPLFYKYWEKIPHCPVTNKSVNFTGFPLYAFNLDNSKRLKYETEEYLKMENYFTEGCDILNKVIENISENKKAEAIFILQVAKYIRNNARTIHRVKRWHYLKSQLGVFVDTDIKWQGGRKNMEDAKKAVKPLVPVENKLPVIEELVDILKSEIENAKETIILVRGNSRLGFENEYGYSCSEEQLNWKIRMAEKTLKEELLPLFAEYKVSNF